MVNYFGINLFKFSPDDFNGDSGPDRCFVWKLFKAGDTAIFSSLAILTDFEFFLMFDIVESLE